MRKYEAKKALMVIAMMLAASIAYVLWLNGARCEGVAHAEPAAEGAVAGRFEPQAASVDAALAMIRYWVRVAPRHPLAKADIQQRFSEWQVAATEQYGTPLSLSMAIMFRESSGRTGQVGPNGELGLQQVHPDTARQFNCDMSTVKGRLLCGHKVLRAGYDKCHTWRGAVTFYASKRGVCRARHGTRLEWVAKDRIRFARELERVAR